MSTYRRCAVSAVRTVRKDVRHEADGVFVNMLGIIARNQSSTSKLRAVGDDVNPV
jgi:hypothetical protein